MRVRHKITSTVVMGSEFGIGAGSRPVTARLTVGTWVAVVLFAVELSLEGHLYLPLDR